jgi:hypothetical protein
MAVPGTAIAKRRNFDYLAVIESPLVKGAAGSMGGAI